jgi:2-C-methyl-D-erythritol 2,4-cyclodiphosphate synthase
MSPYIEKMREALSKTLEIDYTLVNVKATTEEKLGFTGRKEGISAHAVCLLKSKE